MLLFNEQHEQLDAETLKAELADLDNVPTLTDEEVEATLQNYYQQALQLEGDHFGFKTEFAEATEMALFPGIGKLLEKIRKFICGFLTPNSTSDEIINAILQAIAAIIPGGIVIKPLLQLIIKYILSKGIGTFCPVEPAVAATGGIN
jgi:hypothetical protein